MTSTARRGRIDIDNNDDIDADNNNNAADDDELLNAVVAEMEKFGQQVPDDEAALHAIVEGTRAYILSILADAVSVNKRVFPQKRAELMCPNNALH